MTLLYLDQLRSCKVKSALCHAAYHVAETKLKGQAGLLFEPLGGGLQVGRAEINRASSKE